MTCFPQLSTGASSQYPILKRNITRTIRNQCLDGREIKLADPAGSSLEWQLTFHELTDAEASSLQQFFQSMEGSLNTFTFLDPTDNLLQWSEQFDQAAWQKDPLLQVAGSVADPLGGTAAYQLTNSAAAGLNLQQSLNVPAGYYYALSVWVRSDQPGQVTLRRGDHTAQYAVGPNWNRLVLASSSQSADSTVVFGIELSPGSSVDLYGAQAEAQIGASTYKKTNSSAGVHANTRFLDNALAFTTVGPGRHGCVIHLRTN